MKTSILSLILVLFGLPLSAQSKSEPETIAQSKIESATVFLSGAQVARKAEVILNKGRNVVLFQDLARNIDPRSIQVKAPANVLINSVILEKNYLNVHEGSPKIKSLNDSLEILTDLNTMEKEKKTVLEQERKLLMQNQSLASKEQGLNPNDLLQAANFFRKRLTDISDRNTKADLRLRKYKKRKNAINLQLRELNAFRNQASNGIKVVLNTYGNRKVPIEISYVVKDARWTPGYDLRAQNTNSDIQLDYHADVFQNTGVDWENIALTLSSGNPNLGGNQPDLRAWKLYVQRNYPEKKERRSMEKTMAVDESVAEPEEDWSDDSWADEEAEEVMEESGFVDFESTSTLAEYTEVNEGATTAEFKILLPQSVASGSKAQQVSVQSTKLPSNFRHFAVPKLDQSAYLIAEVTDWEQLNLLPGKVQIFFEGTYVTESYIDPAYTSDTLRFSLGRDQRLVVQREKLQDFCSTKVLGTSHERTFAYRILVRNTKSESVVLRLEDQIPISQDKLITVKIEEISGASMNEITGKLEWNLELAPTETKEVKLIYSVKHPRNRSVSGL